MGIRLNQTACSLPTALRWDCISYVPFLPGQVTPFSLKSQPISLHCASSPTMTCALSPSGLMKMELLIDSLEEELDKTHPKFLYVIPTFQNPTGQTLSPERRSAVGGIEPPTQFPRSCGRSLSFPELFQSNLRSHSRQKSNRERLFHWVLSRKYWLPACVWDGSRPMRR